MKFNGCIERSSDAEAAQMGQVSTLHDFRDRDPSRIGEVIPSHGLVFGRFNRERNGGFALVATLLLMVLLSILAVGMLSLSSISLRSGSSSDAMAEARVNARMALMIALSEVQKNLGPDKRVSARAEILDDTPGSTEAENITNPLYLGVWDSWDTWLTDEKGSLSIQDTYKSGRDDSLFRSWLVSNPDATDLMAVTSPLQDEGTVKLCASGSAGDNTANHVSVRMVEIQKDAVTTGRYAWWVSDESQKVRLDLQARDDAATMAKAQIIASQTGRPGIEMMEGMDDFDTTPASLGKMITTGQAGISAADAPRHFHDMTAYSLGLATDVRSGGLKGDLNLAFESETTPDEMDEASIFGGRPYDAPIRPLTGELGGIVPENPYVAPMSWRQLREYYRLYRKDFADGSLKKPVDWSGGKPFTRRYIMSGGPRDLDVGGYARQPVLLRLCWVLATYSKNNSASPGGIDYYVLAIPVSYWWNPYNVTMKVDSRELSSTGWLYGSSVIRQRVYRGDTLVRESRFPDDQAANTTIANENRYLINSRAGFRMIPAGSGGSGSIDFLPGEVRVFSTDQKIPGGNGGGFYATPGYTPVQSGSADLRGLTYRIDPGTGSGEPSISLRIADTSGNQNHGKFFGYAATSGFMQPCDEDQGPYRSVVLPNGTTVTSSMDNEPQPWVRFGVTSIDWVAPDELSDAWIINDTAAERARWGTPGSNPVPIGIFSITAKSSERLAFESSAGFAADFRNRSWLHSPPTRLANFLMNPEALNRADSPYQLHFRPVNGDIEVSEYLQSSGANGYFGGGYNASTGQTRLAMLSLPTAPVMNLGSLAGVNMDHARSRIEQKDDDNSNPSVDNSKLGGDPAMQNYKHLAQAGGSFGAGIGNGYAHPMIQPDKVHTNANLGNDPGYYGQKTTQLSVSDDHWDHLFLANEELWDSWFFSGIVPETNQGNVTKSKQEVAESFFSGDQTIVPPNFQAHLGGKTADELADLVGTAGAEQGSNGWDRIAAHILIKGQFNVNSTSKDAWKALLMSLADRPLALNATSPLVIARDPDMVSLSRHSLANSDSVAGGPSDDAAWLGIRKLSEDEIDKLAEEIVRQVKLRGPFLNMAEFINRRLTDDPEGVMGTLQAAIDWDEFNDGYTGGTSGTGESINKDYKGSGAMITTGNLPASYPNPKAATGSRYAGIPGYVMQSDLLQGLSTSLSVRGDTFLIRTYGDSLTPDGKVAARAWCEAVVQRMPEYVDPADEADKKLRQPGQLPGNTVTLSPTNKVFGRRFQIVSFRWLNQDEI